MPNASIELREITRENVAQVVRLKLKPEQEGLVGTNSNSLAEAYVSQDRAWPRAIYTEGEPVGFVMLDLIGPDHPEAVDGRAVYYVWRLMIDGSQQGKGYGVAAMLAVIAHVKTLPGAQELLLTHMLSPGHAGGFYHRLGFEPTGEIEHGEPVLRLVF